MDREHVCQRFGPSGKCVDCGQLGAWDRCQAVSQPYLDQCGLAAGHSGFHEALNEAGVVAAQWGTPEVPKFAVGGFVAGPGDPDDDRLLVDLSPGCVLSSAVAERFGFGPGLMAMLNSPTVPGLSDEQVAEANSTARAALQAEAKALFTAELAEREAMARSWLSARIVEALNRQDCALSIAIDHNGDVFDALRGEYGGVVISAGQLSDLVDLFTSLLANPPALVTDVDGVTRVEQR